MKNFLNIFKENFPLILLMFYIFGYTYLITYYNQFDISIVKYIDLLDLLFTSINYLVFILVVYIFVEAAIYFFAYFSLALIFNQIVTKRIHKRLGYSSKVEQYIESTHNKYIIRNIKILSLVFFVLATFICLRVIDETLIILSLFFPFLTLKIFQVIPRKNKKQKTKAYQLLLSVFFIILVLCFAAWGYIDGGLNKKTKQSSIIEFKEEGLLYSTKTDSLNFIGETNQFLFLYNKRERYTLVFNKQNIYNMKIKDNSLTKDQKKIQQQQIEKNIKDFFNKKKKSGLKH